MKRNKVVFISQVGLAEAVVRLSSVFSDRPCESLHTQKSKSVFYEPEPGYVIVLSASVPCFANRKPDSTTTDYVYQVTISGATFSVDKLKVQFLGLNFGQTFIQNLHANQCSNANL
jgi:hypothetical protein